MDKSSINVFPFVLREQFESWPRGIYAGVPHRLSYSEREGAVCRHFSKSAEYQGFSELTDDAIQHYDAEGRLIGSSQMCGKNIIHMDSEDGIIVSVSRPEKYIEGAYAHYPPYDFVPHDAGLDFIPNKVHPSHFRENGRSAPHTDFTEPKNDIPGRIEHFKIGFGRAI